MQLITFHVYTKAQSYHMLHLLKVAVKLSVNYLTAALFLPPAVGFLLIFCC